MKLKRGDIVEIISGKDRGKRGKVLTALPKSEKIIVEGVALRKKHQRPRKAGQKGEVINFPSPIHASNVLVLCARCGRGVRTGLKILEDGRKVRICKKCKNEI